MESAVTESLSRLKAGLIKKLTDYENEHTQQTPMHEEKRQLVQILATFIDKMGTIEQEAKWEEVKKFTTEKTLWKSGLASETKLLKDQVEQLRTLTTPKPS